MSEERQPINPKVHVSALSGSGGAVLGASLGSSVADLLSSALINGLGWTLTPANLTSIENICQVLTAGVVSLVAAYVGGWWKAA